MGIQPSPKPCPIGMYRPPGAGISLGECQFCPRGVYGDSPGLVSSDCTAKCPKGTYNDRLGAKSIMECKVCPAGVFGSSTGLTTSACSAPCPNGKYSMTEGLQTASDCIDCPPNYRGPQGHRGNNNPSKNMGGYPCDRYIDGKSILNGRTAAMKAAFDTFYNNPRYPHNQRLDNTSP